jgi:TonB family protein
MNEITGITLAFHCPMKPDGRLYCDRCKHTVLDFTESVEAELAQAVRAANGTVCGKFRKSQMSDQFLRYAATAMIVTTMALPVLGQENKKEGYHQTPPDTSVIEDDVFIGTIVEYMPEPVGGNEKFLAAIKANLRYPEGLTSNGRVYVAFVVDTTGELRDFSIMRGFHPRADQEALRVLRDLNYRFRPGRQAGKPVSTRFVMPIVFER